MSSLDPAIAGAGGAIVGGLVAQAGGYVFQERHRRKAVRRSTNEVHLLGMQETLESARSRLLNLAAREGRGAMAEDYYRTSTLYVLGALLAHKRRLLLDGVYARLDENKRGSGTRLRANLEQVEKSMARAGRVSSGFQRYERQALAESVLLRTAAGWEIDTYLQFQQRYNLDPTFAATLDPASRFVDDLDPPRTADLLLAIGQATSQVADLTKLDIA